jgi:hypothetical protein
VVGANVGGSDTHYWTFRLKNKGTDGGDNIDVIAATDANTTKNSGLFDLDINAVNQLTLHASSPNRSTSAGQILVFEATTTGSPATLVDAVVEIDVEAT